MARVAHRLRPDQTASQREPVALERFFSQLENGKFLAEPGAEAIIATLEGQSCAVVALHPDVDYFTGRPRAYVDILIVAAEAEGKGVGRALMDHVESWARVHSCREVVLDVFAENRGAIDVSERQGYRPDHIRMAKPLV